MESRDGVPSLEHGLDCAACGAAVGLDRIRILALRDDIAFVEIDCPACSSESLGIVVRGDGDGYGEFLPADRARFQGAEPIDGDDVLAVHDLLRRHGLEGLLDPRPDRPGLTG